MRTSSPQRLRTNSEEKREVVPLVDMTEDKLESGVDLEISILILTTEQLLKLGRRCYHDKVTEMLIFQSNSRFLRRRNRFREHTMAIDA